MSDETRIADPRGWHELYSRDWLVHRGCTDEEGRPLAESKAPEEVRSSVPMNRRVCPFPGTRNRHAHPMNVSAFKQMGEHWGEIFDGIEFLRNDYLRTHESPLRLSDLLLLAVRLVNVGNYMLRRAESPVPDGQLPAFVGGIYKAYLGFSGALFALSLKSWAEGGDVDVAVGPDEILEFAEQSRMLIGPAEVCAGSPKAMGEIADVFVAGRDGGNAGKSRLGELMGDLAPFAAYADGVLGLEFLKHLFAVQHETHLVELGTRIDELVGAEGATTESDVWLKREFEAWREERRAWEVEERHSGATVNRIIASQPEPVRARIFQGMTEFMACLGFEEPAREVLGARGPTEDDPRVMTIGQELEEAGGSRRLIPAAQRAVAWHMLTYLDLERRFLDESSRLQERLLAHLGHGDQEIRFEPSDLERALGPTARSLFERLFGGDVLVRESVREAAAAP